MAIHNAVRTSVAPASCRNRPRYPALKSAMDEAERLLEIERLHLLDTPPEPVFDAIVAAARAATGMTMGLITVVAEDRQWFKANIGLEAVTGTARGDDYIERRHRGLARTTEPSTDQPAERLAGGHPPRC